MTCYHTEQLTLSGDQLMSLSPAITDEAQLAQLLDIPVLRLLINTCQDVFL